jgi:hypothetical protein
VKSNGVLWLQFADILRFSSGKFRGAREPASLAALYCAVKGMIQDLKAVLLVGGLGTRLRSVVPTTPKVLASIGKTFFS